MTTSTYELVANDFVSERSRSTVKSRRSRRGQEDGEPFLGQPFPELEITTLTAEDVQSLCSGSSPLCAADKYDFHG